jgi:hypothetical protein
MNPTSAGELVFPRGFLVADIWMRRVSAAGERSVAAQDMGSDYTSHRCRWRSPCIARSCKRCRSQLRYYCARFRKSTTVHIGRQQDLRQAQVQSTRDRSSVCWSFADLHRLSGRGQVGPTRTQGHGRMITRLHNRGYGVERAVSARRKAGNPGAGLEHQGRRGRRPLTAFGPSWRALCQLHLSSGQ